MSWVLHQPLWAQMDLPTTCTGPWEAARALKWFFLQGFSFFLKGKKTHWYNAPLAFRLPLLTATPTETECGQIQEKEKIVSWAWSHCPLWYSFIFNFKTLERFLLKFFSPFPTSSTTLCPLLQPMHAEPPPAIYMLTIKGHKCSRCWLSPCH